MARQLLPKGLRTNSRYSSNQRGQFDLFRPKYHEKLNKWSSIHILACDWAQQARQLLPEAHEVNPYFSHTDSISFANINQKVEKTNSFMKAF